MVPSRIEGAVCRFRSQTLSDLRLAVHSPWGWRASPRQAWGPSHAAVGGAEKKEGETKDDTPPSNGGSPGKGKKGRGKGKKGRGKW